ncbi:MAG TPA: MBG domain-containing protein, partial [Pirellulales bacterium]|nr:MBG domain-containing protein [Pirellulales bacterium]
LNNGTLTVNPYTFTYTIGNDSQTYGSPANLANDLAATISTGVNNETLDIGYASTGDKATANVGSYAITGTLSDGSGSLSNYSVTLNNGALTVRPYAFTYTIGNDSQTYGSAANLAKDLGTTISTGVNNQTLDIGYASTGDKATANVGSYAITGTLSNGSGLLTNYKVTLNNGTLTVKPYAFTYVIGNDFQAEGVPANLAADLPATVPGVNGQYLNIAYSSTGDNAAALPGQYPIKGTLSNDTGQVSNYKVTLSPGVLTVAGPGATVFGNALYLVGGNTNDKVNITPVGTSNTGSTGITVAASLDGVSINNRIYNQSFQAIYVVGLGGNDHIQFGSNLTISAVVVEGNGNDQVQLGNGSNTVTVGNGSDKVQVGNGNNVIVAGDGSDTIIAGNGNDLIVGGLGQDSISAGNGNDILIDGSVSQSANDLWAVLNEWIAGGISGVRADLAAHITYNTTNSNTLHAGSGRDWFWEIYSGDNVNIKPGDLLN